MRSKRAGCGAVKDEGRVEVEWWTDHVDQTFLLSSVLTSMLSETAIGSIHYCFLPDCSFAPCVPRLVVQ